MKVKEENEKAGLKLNIQKMGIEGSYLNIVKAIYDKPTVQFSHSVISNSL